MPPERRRYARVLERELAREERTHAQQARAYAQLWYLALLAWEVEHGRVLVARNNYTDFRNRMHGGISTLGEFLPDQATMLNLPSGQYRETEVGQIISTMMQSGAFETSENGHLLDALRDPSQRKPEGLLRPDGTWQRQTSPAYALAVLSLAVQLRDGMAVQYLSYCRRAFERACGEEQDSCNSDVA